MTSNNWEDWALALPLAVAAVFALTLAGARAPSFASVANAAENDKPDYVMPITGKRLPADCHGVDDAALPAHCIALINATTATMRKVGQ
jgi:hypothetical protein